MADAPFELPDPEPELDGWACMNRDNRIREVTALRLAMGNLGGRSELLRPVRLVEQVPRTVNGTGHTGPSEFCATSI